MPVNLAPQFTQRPYQWTAWKAIQSLKVLIYQYDESTTEYSIWGYDGPEVHLCTIYKGTVPDGVIVGGYSQGQNDTDKTDFETYFKPYANKPINIPPPSLVDGYVTTTDQTTTRIMATTYTEPTTNAQRSIVSSSASDTSAGTGARTARLTYYDQTMAGPFTEDLTLNGTSAVNTVGTNICFIESMQVLTAGSNGTNAGTITLKSTTGGGGSDVGSIAVGDGETNWCHHYVGLNKTMRMSTLYATVNGTCNGVITVRRSKPTVANSVESTLTPAIRAQPGQQQKQTFEVPVQVTGPARLSLFVRADAASFTLSWNAGFGFYEV